MDLHSIRSDEVIVKGIQFEAAVGLDIWHRPHKPQPVVLEIHLTPYGGLEACANEDSVAHTIDYGKLYKALKAGVFGQNFESVTKLYQAIKRSIPETPAWLIRISLPKAILAAREGVEFTWTGETDSSGLVIVLQQMKIPGIECNCIIGVNSHERLEKQRLSIDIVTTGLENRLSQSMHAGVSLDPSPRLAYQDVTQEVVERVEASSYETIEALATAIAQTVTMNHGYDNARITIGKPGGLGGAGASGVSIGRTKAYFENKDFWKVKRT